MASTDLPDARTTAEQAGVVVRAATSLEDADRVLSVMEATWGRPQLMPREIVRALQASGNPPLAAWAGRDVVGFALGWLGPDEAGVHVHSHMLAVLPPWRSKGVGFALKLAQREAALAAGVRVIRWTFDPLVARNARFNLRRLGAVADRFHRAFYGDMTDAINRDDRSDRLEVRWELDRTSPFADRATHGVADVVLAADGDAPGAIRPPSAGVATVAVPPDYPSMKERDRALARAWRDALADALEACFERDMLAVGLDDRGYVLVAPGRAA